MTEHIQRVPLEGSTRVTIEVPDSSLAVSWRDDIDEILVLEHEVNVERAGDEILLRSERSGFRPKGGLFNLLPNISTPDVTIDWGGTSSFIDVSDDEKVTIRAGFGDRERSASSPVRIELPRAIKATSIEVNSGDVELFSPSEAVKVALKSGDLRSSGGNAAMSAGMGTGNAQFIDLSGSLKVGGGVGNIDIRDSNALLKVAAGSGEITLSNVRSEAIKLGAGSGDVVVRECRSDAFSCEAGSGNVELLGGQLERINVGTGSGDIKCTAAYGPHSQSFTSGSGSLSLGVPRDLAARIEAFTSGGDIDTDLPLVSVGQRGPRSRRSNRRVGSVGSGEPRAEISVRSSNGDIRIHWLPQTVSAAIPMPASLPNAPVPPEPPQPPQAPSAPAPSTAPPVQDDGSGEMEPGRTGPQDILESLARGEISVDEADALLETFEARNRGR